MKQSKIINTDFVVSILPTDFQYSPLSDMYAGTYTVPTEDGPQSVPMNLIDIQYQILAGKWKKVYEGIDELGQEATLTAWVDFISPVLFDQGIRTIPYGLYLLIESYRNQPSEAKLAAVNAQIAGFAFVNSMEGFVLQVSDIQ